MADHVTPKEISARRAQEALARALVAIVCAAVLAGIAILTWLTGDVSRAVCALVIGAACILAGRA